MRIKRSLQLWPKSGTVHQYWRCHNKEHYLKNEKIKKLYFTCLELGLKHRKLEEKCKIHAFCAMSNHFHQIISYQEGSEHLSFFMRQAHAIFGARFNRVSNRSGKVAEGRPKTPLIQNTDHEMRVHFYVEANPIRAGICTIENLKDYAYSSYGFYAHGAVTPFTHLLQVPEWYLNLGKTAKQRQSHYRKLFRKYLGEYCATFSVRFKQTFIGDSEWVLEKLLRVKQEILTLANQNVLLSNSILLNST